MKIIDLSLKYKENGNEYIGTTCENNNGGYPQIISNKEGVIFDVSTIKDRMITENDVDLSKVQDGSFVVFYTGFSTDVEFGSQEYYNKHAEISVTLISELIDRGVSVIGIDFPSLRRDEQNPVMDFLSDKDIIIIENIDNLDKVLEVSDKFIANVYKDSKSENDSTCRVIARAS